MVGPHESSLLVALLVAAEQPAPPAAAAASQPQTMDAAPGTSGKKKRALAAAQAQAEAAPAAAAATPADAKSSKKRAKLEAAAAVTTADATGPSPSSSSGDGSAKHGKAAGSGTPKLLAQVQAPSSGLKSALRASIKAFALSPNAETPSQVAAGSAGTGGPSRQTQAQASVSASLPPAGPGKRPRAELGGGKAAMQAQPLAGHSTQAQGSGSAARKVQTAVKAAKQVCGAMWDAGCSCVVGVHMHAASATFSTTCLCIRSQGAIAHQTTAQYTYSLL